MTNELPDVKFENFAAAKSCLQTTLTSTGAIVKELSILSDQNGKAVWQVVLSASGNFPAPTPENFTRVRAVLNQHIPHRGVLRQITRICRMSTTQEWFWTVTYGIKKMSKIRRAITSLTAIIKEVTPCLKSSPLLQTAIRKREKLSSLEQSKERKRFYYQLRHKKSKVAQKSEKESKLDAKYSNFQKGEVLHPTKASSNKTKTNCAPDYERWDINGLFFYMKNITINDAKAMSILTSCDGKTVNAKEIAAAMYHLKNRCPHITKQQLPLMYEKTLERLSIDRDYIDSISMSSDLFERISVKDYPYYYDASNHTMCLHE